MTDGEGRKARAPIDWAALRERLARSAERLGEGTRPPPEAVAAILEARSRAIAASSARPAPAGAPHLVLLLGGERYALAAARVREVLRALPVAPLPGAPPFVAGVAGLRGELVDVIDLRGFLGAGPAPEGARPHLVVLGGARAELAVAVDDVAGLETVDPGALAPAPESPRRERPEYLRGVHGDGLLVLDADAILSDPRLVVDDAAPSRTEVSR